jgi:hypothetical protein
MFHPNRKKKSFVAPACGCLILCIFHRKVTLAVTISILSIKNVLPSVDALNLNPTGFNILHSELIDP